MKKLLSCILVIFILLINIVPCYAANPTLSVGVSDYYVDPGKPITVTVNLSGDSGLGTLIFTVNFNPNEFEYVSASGKTSGVFGENETFTPSNSGQISFSGTTTEPVTSGGSVLTFKLKPLANGGMISLSASATDVEGNPVTVTKSSVKLNCAHSNMIKKETLQEPTCTVYGIDLYECTAKNCTHTERREVELSAHTYDKSTIKTAPTCTKTGIEVGTCTTCGQAGAPSVIPALGHDYSDWAVTKEPTAETMGIRERVCKTCGDKEAQMVAPTGDIIDEPTSEDESTEPSTEQPADLVTEPSTNNFFEIETEPTTEPNSMFGGNLIGSDIAFIVVIALAVLMVGIIIAYLVLLRKKN